MDDYKTHNILNNRAVLEAEVNKPEAIKRLELFNELNYLKSCLEPIAKNGKCYITKDRGYDYFHIDNILETIEAVIYEKGINVSIWQEIKYEIIRDTKINYIETVLIHTKNGYTHTIKTDLNMGETIDTYQLDMKYKSEYANISKIERKQPNNTIQQIMGSSFTYFCRYALVKFFGITGLLEDEDGNVGANTSPKQRTQNLKDNTSIDSEADKAKLYQTLQTLPNQENAQKIKFYVEQGLLTLKAGWYFCIGIKNNMQKTIDEFEIRDKQLQAKARGIQSKGNGTGTQNSPIAKETQDQRVMESMPLASVYKDDHGLLKEQYREGKLDYKTFWRYYFAIQKQDKFVLPEYREWKAKVGLHWLKSMPLNYNDIPFGDQPMGDYQGVM
ncbi:ERF family protein [Candidatus Borreliella tachyglossi]|uniref:ERF family protein n=1 Tax=Candidatus Borreliella tachyglossi TaxID=1964448 RepID=UPI0040436946